MGTTLRCKYTLVAAVLTLLGATAVAQQSGSSTLETSKVYDALALKHGQTVGEIGAGDGEMTIEAARIVGTQGKILTSELGEERVKALDSRVKASTLSQITVIPGDPNQTNFPEICCDAIFMRNVYHHFADPAAMNASILHSLKPGGRVAVVDFEPNPNRGRREAARPADRANDDSHGVSPLTVARELREAGFQIVRTQAGNDRWFMVVAEKPRTP